MAQYTFKIQFTDGDSFESFRKFPTKAIARQKGLDLIANNGDDGEEVVIIKI